MKVILLERIEKLGNLGDVVSVKDGYARNYLLPQGKALRATPANMERFEREREEIKRRNAEARAAAEERAEKLKDAQLVVIRAAGETGHLYGSVTTRDIATAIGEEYGIEIARSQVRLDSPIKLIGLHDVRVWLHPEVAVVITLNVARNEEEAELQAKGEILVGDREERDVVEEVLEQIEAEEGEESGEAEEGEEGRSEGGEEAEEDTDEDGGTKE